MTPKSLKRAREAGFSDDASEYTVVKQLGTGNFGTTNLMLHQPSGRLLAVKSMPRGLGINRNVVREVFNHRCGVRTCSRALPQQLTVLPAQAAAAPEHHRLRGRVSDRRQAAHLP